MGDKKIYLADLGWCFARIRNTSTRGWEITICSPDDMDEPGYSPSHTITIAGHENIVELKKLIDTYIRETENERTQF